MESLQIPQKYIISLHLKYNVYLLFKYALGIQGKEATENLSSISLIKTGTHLKKTRRKYNRKNLKAQDVLTSNSEVLVKQANIY